MPDHGNSSKTIALLAAIITATVALMGVEAWNRAHKDQKPAVVQAAAVTPAAPVGRVNTGRRGQKAVGQDHGTRDAHGEIMMNQ